jgi:hypothetical protein
VAASLTSADLKRLTVENILSDARCTVALMQTDDLTGTGHRYVTGRLARLQRDLDELYARSRAKTLLDDALLSGAVRAPLSASGEEIAAF